MLALRTAIRSRPVLNVVNSARRYRPTPSNFYQPLVDPYTWRARLFYRYDGTPRSKWKGAAYATTAFTILILLNSLQTVLDENYLLSLLVQVQRVDATYSSYDFAKVDDVVSYICELWNHIPDEDSKPDSSNLKQDLKNVIKLVPEVHGTLRDDLEKLHHIMTKDSTQDHIDTAEAVLQALQDLSSHLVEVVQKIQGVALIPETEKDEKPDREDTYEAVG